MKNAESKWPGPWIENISTHGDSRGRWHYAIYWVDDYHPGHPNGEHRIAIRGQHFFANPVEMGHQRLSKWPGMEVANAMLPTA